MIGFILGFIGTFFEEATNTITKKQTLKYNVFQVGIVITFFSGIFFLIYGLVKVFLFNKQIYVNPDSYFLLGIRVFFEILQSYITIIAIQKTDRSTFSIIRNLTIPLLFMVDIIIGYTFSSLSIIGLIILILIFAIIGFSKNKINFNGWKYALFTAVNAVITISLFKYSITFYGNSVEFDQFVVIFSILLFYLVVIIKNKYKIPNLLKDKIFLLQGLSMGIATIFISFSYLFLNSSIATAVKRGGETFWSILYGHKIFKEKNVGYKLILAIIIFLCLILISL